MQRPGGSQIQGGGKMRLESSEGGDPKEPEDMLYPGSNDEPLHYLTRRVI